MYKRQGETVFAREILAAIQELEEIFVEIPRIRGITTVLEYTAPETQRRLFSKELDEYTDAELREVGETATSDQLLTSNLLSKNGALTFAVITLNARDASSEQRLEIADAVLVVQDQLRANHPDVDLFANADLLLEQSSQKAMINDLTSLLPIVILLSVLVICYCFKLSLIHI